MPQTIVAGNWKMHGTKASVNALLSALLASESTLPETTHLLVFAPYIYIPMLEIELATSRIGYGAQTVSEHNEGAYTGEISANMLPEFGCEYVLVGHSEQRQWHNTSDAQVAARFVQAQKYQLTPILCVGETLAERQADETLAVVRRQIMAVIDQAGINALANAVIAYEPVWAIGTGETATPEQAQAVHAEIRALLQEQSADVAEKMTILYGGSVKPENAASLAAMADINGALVGGASLDADKFTAIARAFS